MAWKARVLPGPQNPRLLNPNEQLRYLGAGLGFGYSPSTRLKIRREPPNPVRPCPRFPALALRWGSGAGSGSPSFCLCKPTPNPSLPRCAANVASQGPPRADLAGFPPPLAALSVYSIYLWPSRCWRCQGNPSTPPSLRHSVCAPTASSEPAEGIDPPAPGLSELLHPQINGGWWCPWGGRHLPMAPQGSVRDPKCSSAAPISESLKKWGDPGGWLRQELLNVLG